MAMRGYIDNFGPRQHNHEQFLEPLYVAHVKVKKPLLRKHHYCQHLNFAKKYQFWTEDNWVHVIFSDETGQSNEVRWKGLCVGEKGKQAHQVGDPVNSQAWWWQCDDLGVLFQQGNRENV